MRESLSVWHRPLLRQRGRHRALALVPHLMILCRRASAAQQGHAPPPAQHLRCCRRHPRTTPGCLLLRCCPAASLAPGDSPRRSTPRAARYPKTTPESMGRAGPSGGTPCLAMRPGSRMLPSGDMPCRATPLERHAPPLHDPEPPSSPCGRAMPLGCARQRSKATYPREAAQTRAPEAPEAAERGGASEGPAGRPPGSPRPRPRRQPYPSLKPEPPRP